MSQEDQPRNASQQHDPVKYGDVFPVQGELADKPVAPWDAAMMQMAENVMLGKTQPGCAAAAMQSAAAKNERAGLVRHDEMNAGVEEGVDVSEEKLPGERVITESIGGQVVGQYTQPAPLVSKDPSRGVEATTIGEALEATALTAGQKPVTRSDAAAVQVAEMQATGQATIAPGGVAAAAQSAAAHNSRVTATEGKIKLADVLSDTTSKLPKDKPSSRQDVEVVKRAEMRNDPFLTTDPLGVSASVAAAARRNEDNKDELSNVM